MIKDYFEKYKTDIIGILFVIFYIVTLPNATFMFSEWGDDCLHFCYYLGIVVMGCFAFIAIIQLRKDIKSSIDLKNFIKKHYLDVIFFLISVAVLFTAHSTKVIQLFLLLEVVKSADLRRVFKYIFVVYAVFTGIVILLSISGNLTDLVTARGETLRHSLGFMYSLDLHGIIFSLVLLYLYIKQSSFNLIDFCTLNLMNIILYAFTRARTDFILIIFVISLALLMTKLNESTAFSKKNVIFITVYILLVIWGPIVFTLLSKSDSSLFIKLNSLLSERLTMQKQGLSEFGFNLFGKNIEWVGWGVTADQLNGRTYNFIDNSFLHDGFNFGLLFLILITVMWMSTLIMMKKRGDIYGILIVMVFLLGAVFEYYTMNAYFAPCMYFLSYAFNIENKSK